MERHRRLVHPAARTTHLVLVRHGRTAANKKRLLQGRLDLPLDDFGQRQAERVADHLASQAVDLVLSSPLRRAMMTAQAIGQRVGRVPTVVSGLSEMDFGEFEGSSFEAVQRLRPDLPARLADPTDYDVGWPGGERRGDFYRRVWATFESILRDHAAERVVVVSHGGVLGSFLAMAQGASPNDPGIYDLVNCGVSQVEVNADHCLVHGRNDAIHLENLVDEIDVPEDGTCD